MASEIVLPEAVESELTMAHSEICRCAPSGDPGIRCQEVRDILRREIAAALKEEQAWGIDRGLYLGQAGKELRADKEVARLRAQAEAIRKGSHA